MMQMDNKHTLFTTTVGEKETMEKVGGYCKDRELWDLYRTRYENSLKCELKNILKYPIQLEFELNGTCNYRCESCTYRLEGGNAGNRPQIEFDKYAEIVSDGVRKGLGSIRYNYHNEPLLKKDIAKYIMYAKDAGVVDTYLSTNGSLLNPSMSTALIKSGLDRIQVSIDACNEKTYSILRPGGDYRKVVSNVIDFIALRNSMEKLLPTVRVNFVKQPENKDELQEFCLFWQEQKVDSIGIQDYSDWSTEKNFDKYKNLNFQCNMPFNRLVIRYNGDILPCCLFLSDKLVLGNIYDDSIDNIWNSEKMHELRQLHSKPHGWMKNEICKRCVMSLR